MPAHACRSQVPDRGQARAQGARAPGVLASDAACRHQSGGTVTLNCGLSGSGATQQQAVNLAITAIATETIP
jgi:hypothetical protein